MAETFIGRVMRTIQAAAYAWNQKQLSPIQDWGWDTYEARQFRYFNAKMYYLNTAYSDLVNYARTQKAELGLYKHIRGIYNPVYRLVETYVSKVYGGMLDMEHLTTGAIPILGADDTLREAIKQLWIWSNWGVEKSLFVRNGATCGDAPLKLVDDRERQKVKMEVLDPAKIKDLKMDSVGNVKEVTIQYEVDQEVQLSLFSQIFAEESFVYTEQITKDEFTTYKDGEEFGFYADANGKLVSKWKNDYGFVPLVMARHRLTGLNYGANAFYAAYPKINEVNDLASLTSDQVRKTVNVMWAAIGINAEDEIGFSDEDRDDIQMVYLPSGSDMKPLVGSLDIGGALATIGGILEELERDMPELALHRLRASGNVTAPGVRASFSDAVGNIQEAAGNYDSVLVRAHQMGITMAAIRGYKGFKAYNADSFDKGDLTHYIGERSIINETLSKQEELNYLVSTGAPPEGIWKKMGIADEVIKEWKAINEAHPAMVEAKMNAAIAAQAAGQTLPAKGQPVQ